MAHKLPIGPRTLKTALAVVFSMVLASFFGELSIFPALSAIAVMSRAFTDGLQECRNQAVGITIGGILGCHTCLVCPDPPILLMGVGVVVVIFLCTSLHVAFSCSLSCAIFIIACMTEPNEVVASTLTRLFHTAIGLSVGLSINYLIVPYDNRAAMVRLLRRLLELLPDYLHQCLYQGLHPDLTALEDILDTVHRELATYRRQRFRRRAFHQQEAAYLAGCCQLAERAVHELTALCTLDAVGTPDPSNLQRLTVLGVLPEPLALPGKPCDSDTDTVTNYHLRMLLDAAGFLEGLLLEWQDAPKAP